VPGDQPKTRSFVGPNFFGGSGPEPTKLIDSQWGGSTNCGAENSMQWLKYFLRVLCVF